MEIKNSENLIQRQPVVVILGHVDSGKTSILDSIKKSRIAEKESGGITQHIGAYEVEKNGKRITFLDTPGHEAFSAMRSRGAKVADIAVLVIDGVQGIQPQTKEAIENIKKSEVLPIVAINKTDLPTANPQRIKQELIKEGFQVESMAGKIPSIDVSARTGQGIEELLDLILLVVEMESMKADLAKPAEGAVIEAFLNGKRGPTATLILENGTLKNGDIIATPSAFAKIKMLEDFQGKLFNEVLPGQPAVVMGFEAVPKVGEKFQFFSDLESAQSFMKPAEKKIFQKAPEEGKKTLNLILKADVAGSLEAIEEVLAKIPQENVSLNVLNAEAGNIDESDLKMAKANKAFVLAFRIKTSSSLRLLAERENVRILDFEIIYELVESVRKRMEALVRPEAVRREIGRMKVLAVFLKEKNRQILGGKVQSGEIEKGTQIEVQRREELAGRGRLVNLQRNKKDIDKCPKGDECGILFEGDVAVQEDDILIFFKEERA